LNGDVEHLGLLVVKAQQGTREDEVAGGRNRQKLGQPFHHTHDGRFE
jgi:hypothetical protein